MQARRPINSQKWKRRLRWVLPLLLFCFFLRFFCCRCWLFTSSHFFALLLAQLCDATTRATTTHRGHINRKECEEMQNANTTNTTTFQMHSWCLPFKCAQLLLLLWPERDGDETAGQAPAAASLTTKTNVEKSSEEGEKPAWKPLHISLLCVRVCVCVRMRWRSCQFRFKFFFRGRESASERKRKFLFIAQNLFWINSVLFPSWLVVNDMRKLFNRYYCFPDKFPKKEEKLCWFYVHLAPTRKAGYNFDALRASQLCSVLFEGAGYTGIQVIWIFISIIVSFCN